MSQLSKPQSQKTLKKTKPNVGRNIRYSKVQEEALEMYLLMIFPKAEASQRNHKMKQVSTFKNRSGEILKQECLIGASRYLQRYIAGRNLEDLKSKVNKMVKGTSSLISKEKTNSSSQPKVVKLLRDAPFVLEAQQEIIQAMKNANLLSTSLECPDSFQNLNLAQNFVCENSQLLGKRGKIEEDIFGFNEPANANKFHNSESQYKPLHPTLGDFQCSTRVSDLETDCDLGQSDPYSNLGQGVLASGQVSRHDINQILGKEPQRSFCGYFFEDSTKESSHFVNSLGEIDLDLNWDNETNHHDHDFSWDML